MFLNVGGAVLGVAVLTVIDNSVESMQGGAGNFRARLKGYRAVYYGAITLCALAAILSFFTIRTAAQASVAADIDEEPAAGLDGAETLQEKVQGPHDENRSEA